MIESAELQIHLARLAQRARLGEVDTRPPIDCRVNAGELSIHALDWGGGGPDVVLLHGGALNAHTWDAVCLALRSRYRCVAIDLRGHGESEWSSRGDYSYAAYERDVRAAIDTLAIHDPLVVGQSLGGLVTIGMASSGSPSISGAVLVDVGPDIQESGRRRIHDFLDEERALDSIEDFVDRAVRFTEGRDPDLLRMSLRRNLRPTRDGKLMWKWDPAQFSSDQRASRDEHRRSLWELVPKVACPTLVIRGGRSDIFHEGDARKLVDALPNARLMVIAGAGHNVQGDRPSSLASAIDAFCASLA